MKLFIYVSRVPHSVEDSFVPVNFRSICQSSRKKNQSLGISSIISYKFGCYLQVLEGPRNAVNQQIVKILCDQRHRDIKVLLDKEVSFQQLSSSGMRVIPNLARSRSFRGLVEENSAEFSTLSKAKKERLSHFFDLEYLGLDGSANKQLFEDSMLKLSSMPCVNDIQVTPNLVRLTNTLIKSEKSLESLQYELQLEDERELIESLSRLRKLGLLQLRKRKFLNNH